MTFPGWTLMVRDGTLATPFEVDDYEKLDYVVRFRDVGGWVLDVPAGGRTAAALATPGSGLVVTRSGGVVMSGPTELISRSRSGDANMLEVSGKTDEVYLDDRLALPCAPPYTAQAYDVRTGPAETVLKAYVTANATPSAWGGTQRQVSGLTVETDLGRGATYTASARFDALLAMLQQIALAGGDLGWRVMYLPAAAPGVPALQFQVFVPRDLTGAVVFSDGNGNLGDFNYALGKSDANYVIVGGGGEGTARIFAEGGDSSQQVLWGRRVERFADRRDTTDPTALVETVTTNLSQWSPQTALGMTPNDTAAIQYRRDYDLGDKVGVVIDASTITGVIREVHVTLDSDGELIVPTVGTPGAGNPDETLGLFGAVDELWRRVASLERR